MEDIRACTAFSGPFGLSISSTKRGETIYRGEPRCRELKEGGRAWVANATGKPDTDSGPAKRASDPELALADMRLLYCNRRGPALLPLCSRCSSGRIPGRPRREKRVETPKNQKSVRFNIASTDFHQNTALQATVDKHPKIWP